MKKLLMGLVVLLLILGFAVLWACWRTGEFEELSLVPARSCKAVSGPVGPEDISIDHASNIAFVSAADWRAVVNGEPPNGKLWAYDLPSGELLNLLPNSQPNFHPHGLSLHRRADGGLSVFVINHQDGRQLVEIYDYQPDKLTLMSSIEQPEMLSLNDVLAVGDDEFYASNDHSTANPLLQLGIDSLELATASVIHCKGQSCQVVADDIQYANGLALSADQSKLFVASVTGRAVLEYQRDGAKLALLRSVDVGTGADNIEVDQQGRLWIGAHPRLLRFIQHAANPDKPSPSQVIRVDMAAEPVEVTTVYQQPGAALSASSVGAPAAGGRRVLIGSVFAPHFLDCEL